MIHAGGSTWAGWEGVARCHQTNKQTKQTTGLQAAQTALLKDAIELEAGVMGVRTWLAPNLFTPRYRGVPKRRWEGEALTTEV